MDALELPRHFVEGRDLNGGLFGIQCASRLIEDARLQNIKSNVDPALRTAIEQRRLIRFFYQNKERVIEPHDYGIQNGSFKLLSKPNWRLQQWIASRLAMVRRARLLGSQARRGILNETHAFRESSIFFLR